MRTSEGGSGERGPVTGYQRRVARLVTPVLLAALFVGSGAVLGAVVASGAGAAGGAAPPSIKWAPCPTQAGYQCGTLRVPLDYSHPNGATVDLSVIRHQVADSKGVVVFNPGGPGESGVLILPLLAQLVPPSVRAQFTLVSFDERGTGSSGPLSCGPSPAQASSALPTAASGVKTFSDLEASCRARYAKVFSTVNTTTSARDMDQLRQALGVPRIDYYGISYGTALGSVYAHLFPTHYKAMILDGAVDLNLGLTREASEEAPALEASLVHALAACTAATKCPISTDPIGTYEHLQAVLSKQPMSIRGGPPVTVGDLYSATLLFLSAPDYTPGYFPALADAAFGNALPLRTLALTLEQDLNASSLVSPLWAITCNDVVSHPSARATTALGRELQTRYPLLGAEAMSNNLIGCPGWKNVGTPVAHLSATTGPTPLIIGNTGDPNTPYVEAGQLASTLGGRLVTYVSFGHSWILNGSSSTCMQGVVSAYLLQSRLPAPGTRCT
jgi:pimeloyl-ACP methyl ester carboxylesterase